MITAAIFGKIKNGYPDIDSRYFKHIEECNVKTKPVHNTNYQNITKQCDCLVVCGGGDINPKWYNQKPYDCIYNYDDIFDECELSLINTFIVAKKPILGICRGMQSINVALGGTLIQDIPSILGLCHLNAGGDDCMHEIKISPASKLYTAMGLRAIVNSRHHQCVHILGRGLSLVAASHDGVTEAFENELILGVQWHPERMSGNTVFEHFFKTYLK